MQIYLVMKYTRDGSMGTTDENTYDILDAFTTEKGAKDYMDAIVKEYNQKHVSSDKQYDKVDGEDRYRRITFAGSPIDDDIDFKEIYIDELKVKES